MRKQLGRAPRLTAESALHAEGHVRVAGVDEVGRGALGGPVSIGVVVVVPGLTRPPRGLRDSKLLTPLERERLVPRIRSWVPEAAVGHASAAEIDAHGIIAALRLAGHRALAALPLPVDVVLLDGNHDYLTVLPPVPPTEPAPLDLPPPWVRPAPDLPALVGAFPAVRTIVRADQTCASVAAASVLAKVTRDAMMVELAAEHGAYGWEGNKGYASPGHRAALLTHGPCVQHRRSWRLAGGAFAPARSEGDGGLGQDEGMDGAPV